MTNSSIFAAFERMWFHVTAALGGKSNIDHTHDDVYYTESEIDSKLEGKADTNHNHDGIYEYSGISETAVNNHDSSDTSHSDIRSLISSLTTQLNNFLDVDDTTKDQLSEIIGLIENNEDLIEAITTGKVSVADIVDNLTTNVTNKPLSAAQGVVIKGLIDTLQDEVDSHVHNYASSSTPGGSATSAITLDGLTVTVSELNLVDGVTSNIQSQIDAEISARESGDETTLTAAKDYTDERIADSLKSNYDLWLSLGNTGTPADFLEWLRGDSAYDFWVQQEGNEGKTEEEFLASLDAVTSEELSQILVESKAYVDEKLTNANTEEWTFILEDGSSVTKKVVLG